jgi:hypothetical protein
MADREIIRPPDRREFPQVSDAGFRYLQQIANEINRIRSGTTFGENLTDYLEVEDDGTVRFYGAATTWMDINVDLVQNALGASAPGIGTVGGGTIKYLLFDGVSTIEEVSGSVEINHNVRLDVIKPHIHWFPTTAGAGNVKWFMTYTINNVGDAEPAETTISVITATPGAVQSTVSGFSDIDISGFTEGAQLCYRIYRDPTDGDDTYAADVATKTLGLHVEIHSMGTRGVIVD